jgi:hypothetical protein
MYETTSGKYPSTDMTRYDRRGMEEYGSTILVLEPRALLD